MDCVDSALKRDWSFTVALCLFLRGTVPKYNKRKFLRQRIFISWRPESGIKLWVGLLSREAVPSFRLAFGDDQKP